MPRTAASARARPGTGCRTAEDRGPCRLYPYLRCATTPRRCSISGPPARPGAGSTRTFCPGTRRTRRRAGQPGQDGEISPGFAPDGHRKGQRFGKVSTPTKSVKSAGNVGLRVASDVDIPSESFCFLCGDGT